jgi:hypothetical protein
MSFNKMIETQLAQVATVVLVSEKVNAVTTRGGKSTRDLPYPNRVGKATEPQEAVGPLAHEDTRAPKKETAPQEFVDTSFLSFPTRN